MPEFFSSYFVHHFYIYVHEKDLPFILPCQVLVATSLDSKEELVSTSAIIQSEKHNALYVCAHIQKLIYNLL